MNDMMQKFELQKKILEKWPKRSELLEYEPVSQQIYYGTVYRNHSFELVEHGMVPYLDYAGMQIKFNYSDYDDSLSFINLDEKSDFLIIWLDVDRYKENSFSEFFLERMNYLKTIYKKPVLVALCSKLKLNLKLNGQIQIFDFESIQSQLGKDFFDERLEKYSGTRMSAKACLLAAEQLGLRYLPSLLRPALKAIVLDLDNTLYKGVLGEEGVNNIELTYGHKKLQNKLKQLSLNGFLLCVVSKNEYEDVKQLFEVRLDFPLKWEDFAIVHASWDEKSQSIEDVCKELNIGVDSVLFIDDNYGELMKAYNHFPTIHEIHASENGEITERVLSLYPGLLKSVIAYEDSIRKADLQANDMRKKLQSEYSATEYMKALQIKLRYHINDISEIHRISELANKTNQFIFSYKRYTETELADRIDSKKYAVCTVSLEDKLSDSGIIAVCVMYKNETVGYLEECFVSCRALGRGLDEMIVLGAIKFCMDQLDVRSLNAAFTNGERNKPAKVFFDQHFSKNILKEIEYEMPQNLVECTYKSNY